MARMHLMPADRAHVIAYTAASGANTCWAIIRCICWQFGRGVWTICGLDWLHCRTEARAEENVSKPQWKQTSAVTVTYVNRSFLPVRMGNNLYLLGNDLVISPLAPPPSHHTHTGKDARSIRGPAQAHHLKYSSICGVGIMICNLRWLTNDALALANDAKQPESMRVTGSRHAPLPRTWTWPLSVARARMRLGSAAGCVSCGDERIIRMRVCVWRADMMQFRRRRNDSLFLQTWMCQIMEEIVIYLWGFFFYKFIFNNYVYLFTLMSINYCHSS